MLKEAKAFSGFSVDDLAVAKKFYGQTLGLDVVENDWPEVTRLWPQYERNQSQTRRSIPLVILAPTY